MDTTVSCKEEEMRKRRKKTQVRVPFKGRLTALILIFIMVISSLSPLLTEVMAASAHNPWDGKTLTVPEVDENGTYLIRTGAELAWFAAEVNRGNGEINGRLENYIYLNDFNTTHKWTMIGDTEANPYRGDFDGNGQKIVYMRAEITHKDPGRRYAGLFGVIDGGTVRNVTVLGKVIQGYGNYGLVGGSDQFCAGSGGIAGYLKNGQIINCTNYARTTMDGDAMYRNSGGIVGICRGVVIHCTNEGKLSTIIGIAQNHIGGIAGLVYGVNGQVVNCVNNATVQGYFCVGGIAGAVKGGGEINASCNYGAIKGNSIIGGIAGRVSTTGVYSNGTPKECLIKNVYSLGTLSGYGTGSGSQMGGIAGYVGYEDWKQEALPPMPVIENAYSSADLSNTYNDKRGGVIGYLISGGYGTVYGLSGTDKSLNPVGAQNDRATQILGEARMMTEEELKSAGMIDKLGSAFTMANTQDTQNQGFPKLVWQGLPSVLLSAIDEAHLELNGWLSDANRKKYGKNYSHIEAAVNEYKEKLGTVTSQEDLDGFMEEARTKLKAIKPGIDADNELMDAIDIGIIALLEYMDKLLAKHTDLTDGQKLDLESVATAYTEKLNAATSLDEVQLLIRDGRDAMDAKIASIEADKRLEEIRANAIQVLTAYRAEENYDVTWMHKIKMVREDALELIAKATSSAEVTSLLEKAKNDIDAVIDQVPEAGAWDGKTLTEPLMDDRGIYQITSGSELAWFANAVNVEGKQDISGELCKDISLGFNNWKPIGSQAAYTGNFDGMGYMIRGLYIDLAQTYAGLFGRLQGKNQVIQNLSVSGSIQVDGKVGYAGGVAAYINGADLNNRVQITNCHSSVSIRLDGMRTMGGGTGGIAGYTSNIQMANCSNTGSVVMGPEGKGGITYSAGGLIGRAAENTSLQTSFNTGTVQSTYTAGGLIGDISNKGCTLYSSYNAGEISATMNAGGLAGTVLSYCGIKWCYTSGPINLLTSGRSLGALFGTLTGGDYDVLYALKRSDSLGRSLVGASSDFSATGKFLAESELQKDDALNSLNGGGSCFIRDYLGFQNGYPILEWQMTLEDFKIGAISELQTFVHESDYSEENWAVILGLVSDGAARIQAAEDMESVNVVLTQTKNEIYTIETLAGTVERKLQEAREEAINILDNYVDLTEYRDEEQTLIRETVSDAKKRIMLAFEIEDVNRCLDDAKSKIDSLPTIWQYYEQLNLAAAAQVDGYIMNIGEVIFTAYVKTSIQIARSAYDGLTDEQKALVSTYQVLLDAEEVWAQLEEENEATEQDMEMAAVVDALIEAIGEVTADSKEAIDAARYAFDALTEAQKALVNHPETLTGAEEAYNKLCASYVSTLIAAIGEVTLDKRDVILEAQRAYDALTEAQKAFVQAYPALQNAVTTYQNLVVAQSVIEQIDAIGEVTLERGDAIMAAIRSYNALTAAQQALVNNSDILEAAAAVYDSLVAVEQVIEMINQISTVSQASKTQLANARNAYNNLTPDEKQRVTNLSVLENAEAAYEALQNPEVDNNHTTDPIPPNNQASGGISGSSGSGSPGTGKDGGDENESAEDDGEEGKENGIEETTAGEMDGSMPSWLEEELNGSDPQADPTALSLEKQRLEERKNNLIIMGIVLAACTVLTAAFGIALRKSAHKRKEKQVHY